MNTVAELLVQNHERMLFRFVEANCAAGVRICDSTFVCTVVRCDDRLAQGLLYACGQGRFAAGDTPGSAVGVLSVEELVRFLDIAGQNTIALAIRSRPMVNHFWALGFSDGGVMLESQRFGVTE